MKKIINPWVLEPSPWKYDLKMKLTVFFAIICLFQLKANSSYSQNTRLSIDMNEVTLNEVIRKIESLSEFKFFYNRRDVDLEKVVSVKEERKRISTILSNLFSEMDITFQVVKKQIVLKKKRGDLATPIPVSNDESTFQLSISGTITDQDGSPLPGASIIEKGTTNGVTSDFDGNFSLTLEGENAVLVVSYIGYATQEVTVNGQNTIDVSMRVDAASLEEVVVVGYGTQNKRAVTSAIATVSSEELGENPSDAFTRALSGKVAGVQVQQTTGAPGGVLKVRVRGTGSLNAGNDPLYVIDGFPVESSVIDNNRAGDQGFNPLSSLNPDDIASIEVLKDAAASAIYGSRGANGVVIITTKRGETGKPQFSFTTSLATQSVHNKVDLLTGDQFLDLLRESWENAAATTQPGLPMLGFLSDESQFRGVNTDWQDEIFRTGIVQNYQLSASGGTDKFKYFISGGLLNEEGIIIESDFKRYSMRANLDAQLTDRLKWGVSLTPSYTINNEVNDSGHWAGNGVILSALIAFPFLPPDASTEEFVNSQTDFACCGTPNPAQIARERDIKTSSFRLLTNSYLEYDILEGLKAKTSIGFDYLDYESNDFEPGRVRRNNNNTRGFSRKLGQRTWLSENTLNYNKSFNKHNVNALGGFTYQEYREQDFELFADGLQNEAVRTITDAAFDRVTGARTVVSEWSLVSFLGRLNYSYDNKYLLSAAIRRDGSSRFGANNRYATFPSISAGWVVSEESFLENVENLSLLKLRASYGKTGNNTIGDYASLGLLQGGQNYVLGSGNGSNIGGLAPNTLANPDLTWETTEQYNFGFELGLFKNRISLTADHFISETEDLLLGVPIPATTGFTAALQNLGRIENKGWEFLLSTRNFTGDFNWNTDFNITFTTNEILELGPEGDPIRSGSARGRLFLNEIGGELGAFNVYKQIGIFQTQEEVDNSATFPRPTFPGDIKYQDTDGDGVITDADRVVIGSNLPDYIWGITNNFSYKNWDLSVVINGAHGGLIHNVQGAFTLGLQGFMNQYASTLGRWRSPSEPGDGMTPRATFDTTGNNSIAETSRFVEDGSFTRIQNVTLGYNFPSEVTDKMGISSLRCFLSGNNLATFTDFQGYNPEVSFAGGSALSGGADYGAYPLATRFTLGLKFGF